MASFRTWTLRITEFVLSKYPFLNALSLLMLLAERNESYPPVDPRWIYGSVGVLLGCGFLMSVKTMLKEAGLVCAAVLGLFSYTLYTNRKLHYGEWHRMQMASRQFGCVAVYLLFSHFSRRKAQQWALMRRMGEMGLGFYLLSYAYILNESSVHKQAFLSHILGGDWSRYFFTLVIVACALSFFAGVFLRDICVSVLFVLGALLIFIDCRLSYWTARGLHFWLQVRLVLDTVCAMTGIAMFTQHFENVLGDFKVE